VQTAGYTARLGLTLIEFSGNSNAFSSTVGTFTNLEAGSHRTFSVFLDTTQTGTFSGTYLLTCSDEDLPGAQTLPPLTVTVAGEVDALSFPLPPPLTIQCASNVFTVSWPSNASRLETRFNLTSSDSWQTISNGLATNGPVCTFTFTNSTDIQEQFFRLVFP
jgi:hypothetical protein